MTEPIPNQPSKPSVTTIHPSHSTSTVPITKKTPSKISWTGHRGVRETASGASTNVGGEVGAGESTTTPRRQSSPGSSGMRALLFSRLRFAGYRPTGQYRASHYARRMPGQGELGDGWVTELLQVGGSSIYFRRSTHTDGVPFVHLHGFAISGAYLLPTARALTARGVNVVPDLPGYGRSERREHV